MIGNATEKVTTCQTAAAVTFDATIYCRCRGNHKWDKEKCFNNQTLLSQMIEKKSNLIYQIGKITKTDRLNNRFPLSLFIYPIKFIIYI